MFQPLLHGSALPDLAAAVRFCELGPEHLTAITAIYRHAILQGATTFEDPVPDEAELARRLMTVRRVGLPALAAVDRAGNVLGFAWARPFRERAGYRLTVENSVYVAAAARRQGIGALLLAQLIEACRALGCRRMIAVIGDARNHASIALHQKAGFVPAAFFSGMGVRPLPGGGLEEIDVIMMQRELVGSGAIGHA